MEGGMAGFVCARVDEALKTEAAAVLDSIGLTMSDAIRMLLTRIARDKALPSELKVPNAETIAAMLEGREMARRRDGRFETADDMFRRLEGHDD